MKYLKYFEQELDYQTFINGDNFIKPNVSYVLENVSVVYNGDVMKDTFSIDGKTYYFDNGMTWSEWLDSSYNVDGYVISPGESGYVICNSANKHIGELYGFDGYEDKGNGNIICTILIIKDKNYELVVPNFPM